MIDLVLKDRVILQMRLDSRAGMTSTQLTLATSLGTSRAQVCTALKKLTDRGLVARGRLLGAPPNRGTYSYRLTPAGHRRAAELEGQR